MNSNTDSTPNPTTEIRDFVITNFLFGETGTLKDDTSFMDAGVIDSTGMLELIMFLEQTYDLKIEPEEMLPENLDSVNKVAQFLARKQTKAAAA